MAHAMGASKPAYAFCRELTASPPAGYSEQTQGCFNADGLKELYWKNDCIGFDLQKDGSKIVSAARASEMVATAFATWMQAPCPGGHPSIGASALGSVACGQVEYNSDRPNQNTIVFRDDAWPYTGQDGTLA